MIIMKVGEIKEKGKYEKYCQLAEIDPKAAIPDNWEATVSMEDAKTLGLIPEKCQECGKGL